MEITFQIRVFNFKKKKDARIYFIESMRALGPAITAIKAIYQPLEFF